MTLIRINQIPYRIVKYSLKELTKIYDIHSGAPKTCGSFIQTLLLYFFLQGRQGPSGMPGPKGTTGTPGQRGFSVNSDILNSLTPSRGTFYAQTLRSNGEFKNIFQTLIT